MPGIPALHDGPLLDVNKPAAARSTDRVQPLRLCDDRRIRHNPVFVHGALRLLSRDGDRRVGVGTDRDDAHLPQHAGLHQREAAPTGRDSPTIHLDRLAAPYPLVLGGRDADRRLELEPVLGQFDDLPGRFGRGGERASHEQLAVDHLGAAVADDALMRGVVVRQDADLLGRGVDAGQVDGNRPPARNRHQSSGVGHNRHARRLAGGGLDFDLGT